YTLICAPGITAPDESTIWPDNLAVWPMAIAAIMMRMETIAKTLARRMSIPASRAACLAASFLNISAEFLIPRDLIRVQHCAYLSLRVFFNGLDLRAGFSPQLSDLFAAFFKDLIHPLTLLLGQAKIIVNSVYIAFTRRG